eukprot:2805625-Pyramimonas_sp.AAC.1
MLDVKGYMMDVKGYMMDVKGYMTDVKGYMMDVKGYMMAVKGYMMAVKGYMMDVKGYVHEVMSATCVCAHAIHAGGGRRSGGVEVEVVEVVEAVEVVEVSEVVEIVEVDSSVRWRGLILWLSPDPGHLEACHAGGGVVTVLLGAAAVDHVHHVVDGDGRLRNVRGQHHLTHPGRGLGE